MDLKIFIKTQRLLLHATLMVIIPPYLFYTIERFQNNTTG